MRETVETLVGVGWRIVRQDVPLIDEHGQPSYQMDGVPKVQQLTTIEFVDQTPAGVHVTRIPLEDEARRQLVQALTGGIDIIPALVLPANGGKP